MSHGGGGSGSGQPACAGVSLGKYVRGALRKRIKDEPKRRRRRPAARSGVSSVELISSSSSSSASASAESVVRVVLAGGVVEVYAGVVLACTVIRNHPPGLCLAYPDVFRNPHGAGVRPLEPLFPGQKLYLLPETTMKRLQENIPESSIGAFDDEQEDEDEEDTQDHGGGGAASSSSSSSEEEEAAGYDGDGGAMRAWCCAREYFEAKERWEACQLKQMAAAHGIVAVEESAGPDRRKTDTAAKKRGERSKKKAAQMRRRDPAAAPTSVRRRRTWEPSLPSVEEESSELLPSPVS